MELVVVLAVLGICIAGGAAPLAASLSAHEARGAAQGWQTAVAWAQTGMLWHGGSTSVTYERGSLRLAHDYGLSGGALDHIVPEIAVSTNTARWRSEGGAVITIGGDLASPDGGGSLFFHSHGGSYRVTVRPVSGLTVRGPLGVEP